MWSRQLSWHTLSRVYICTLTHADESWDRMYGTFVHCSAFSEAANRPCVNVLYTNSLCFTDNWRIAFGYLPNIRRIAECCLPSLGNTTTSNVHIVFECRVCILFTFRCKPSFRAAGPFSPKKYTLFELLQERIIFPAFFNQQNTIKMLEIALLSTITW